MSGIVALPAAVAQDQGLSASMNVHVFPREGQDEVQQSMDEAECYTWAVDRTGTDPFDLSRQAAEQAAAAESDEATKDGISHNGVAKLSVQTWESGILR